MKFDFTEGEWHIKKEFICDRGNYIRIVNNEGSNISTNGPNEKENIANALLISCAPEMLNGLIKYCEIYSRMNGDIENNLYIEFKKIIKSATGKTWEEINDSKLK